LIQQLATKENKCYNVQQIYEHLEYNSAEDSHNNLKYLCIC